MPASDLVRPAAGASAAPECGTAGVSVALAVTLRVEISINLSIEYCNFRGVIGRPHDCLRALTPQRPIEPVLQAEIRYRRRGRCGVCGRRGSKSAA
jgi:hypothetical protein